MIYGNKQYKPYKPLLPTPSDIPLETACLTINAPSNPAWIGLWIGALLALTDPENYQEFEGGISRETTAEIWSVALDEALLGFPSCELSEPFWDDAEGDDAASGEDNPSYPFYEDVANFAIAGFVLYATGSPTAALEYWTTAQQFRLAFRKHDNGGIVKIFMDTFQLGEIDTYSASPSLEYFDVVSTGSTLRLEFPTEGTVTEVIRKRLWAGEIVPSNIRWDLACECIQTHDAGRGVWYDNPSADPRYNTTLYYPPLDTSNPHCDAAANMVQAVRTLIEKIILAVSVVQAANAIMEFILIFVPGVDIIVTVIIAIAEGLLTIGTTTIALAFSEEVYDQLTCIFYNNIDNDGSMSLVQMNQLLADVDAQIGGTVSAVMSLIALSWGNVGFTNAGASGEETGDCSPCGWCYEFDFAGGQQGFTMKVCNAATQYGSWTGSAFSQAVYGAQRILYLYKTWTPVTGTITSVEITVSMGGGQSMNMYNTGCTGLVTYNPTSPSAGVYRYTVSRDTSLGYIYLNWIVGTALPNQTITKIKFRGDGTNPFGADNC